MSAVAAFLAIEQGWRIGVPTGMGAGIAFGIGCEVLDTLFEVFQPHEHPSFPGETLSKAGAATAVGANEAVRGWLYLTNKKLY